jgi:hypothetical protein
MDTVVRFGKYTGKAWPDVLRTNENYVRWVLCSTESGRSFPGVDAHWICWAKELGLLEVLSGMSVTDVAKRRARDAMHLPSVARVVWVTKRVGEPLPCPDAYTPAEYGTFVDYVVRHHTASGAFCDDRAAKVLAGEALAPTPRSLLQSSYERCARGATVDVLADLFIVSKAHAFYFSGQWSETALCKSHGAGWLASLVAMLAEALPSGEITPNPVVGTKLPSGKMIRGDADLLIEGELVELKATAQLSHELIACQVLLYAALLRKRGKPVVGARVINVATGTMTRADLCEWDEAELLRWLEDTLVAL